MSSTTRPRSKSRASASPGDSFGGVMECPLPKAGKGGNAPTVSRLADNPIHSRVACRGRWVARPLRRSVSIGLDIQQRIGADNAWQVGGHGRVQIGFVDLSERGDAAQSEISDAFVFQRVTPAKDAR